MSETENKSNSCVTCGIPKARLHCGVCQAAICKSCAVSTDETGDYSNFALMANVPQELVQPAYCPACFVEKVSPAYQRYLEILERAQNVIVYEKTQKKETRLMKRTQKPLRVESCPDRQETLMRLAFMAADAGFNGLIDVDLAYKKIRGGSYQTTEWSGSGIPALIDEGRVPRDRSIWSNPN